MACCGGICQRCGVRHGKAKKAAEARAANNRSSSVRWAAIRKQHDGVARPGHHQGYPSAPAWRRLDG